jgi:hypothetical protein
MSLSPKSALTAGLLALATGAGGATLLATSAGASPVAPARAVAARTGTGTVSLTGPKGKTATRTVPVSCRVSTGHYVVLAGRPGARRGADLRLSVKDYTGAGRYTAALQVTRHAGARFGGHRYGKVPVTLTADGGSFTYSRTLSGKRDSALKGKTVSVSASWSCSV